MHAAEQRRVVFAEKNELLLILTVGMLFGHEVIERNGMEIGFKTLGV